MFHSTPPQLTSHANALTLQEPTVLKPLNWSEHSAMPGGEMQNGGLLKAQNIHDATQRHQDEVQKLGIRIKHHEDNLRFLKAQMDNLDESILDMQVKLGNYHSSSVAQVKSENRNHLLTEENTINQILQQETAAGVLCQLKIRHGGSASQLPFTKDVLGIVATLGKVEDDNLSRLLAEYLGLETMMGVVCKTYEGINSLEGYDEEGRINQTMGLHGLAPSIGRILNGRFVSICLEDLRPYVGEFVANDPQLKLALLKPRLASGECPPGFLGFAVNMIDLDNINLSYLTASGHGLRETLFYNLFSRLQVYRTRKEMLLARPCISHGALSLDGGIIKTSGVFTLGNRKEVEVRFPVSSGEVSNVPVKYHESEEKIKFMKWEKERVGEDIQREQHLLQFTKQMFETAKQDYLKLIAQSNAYVDQHETHHTPR